jgi:NAD(P)-dependent dehydrogenase (short-subunit alcohol dehydrogenase family)
MEKELRGKLALITGASKGLGKAMALALAEAGADLILVARNRELLEETAAAARASSIQAECFPADVASEEQVRELEQNVRNRYGQLDILINNAGINVRKPITEFSLAEWKGVLETNLVGAFLMCRSFVPLMKGRGYGRIINLTSIMSHVALAGRTAYAASKAGLLGFTKALALELAPDGITVNGVSPGPIGTEMNTVLMQTPELNQQFVSRIPLGRWGRVEEVGGLVRYLCSPAAGFITGTDLVIDGGWCAQ